MLVGENRLYASQRRAPGRSRLGLLIAGVIVILLTGIVFWGLRPRGGVMHRFVDTEWEPYIGVALTAAVALGATLMLSGVLDFLS